MKFKKAGIIAKPHKDVKPFLELCIRILKEMNVEFITDTVASEMLGNNNGMERELIPEKSDIIILIGGDGTFLSVAPYAQKADIPIAGFNLGTLGFLTEIPKNRMEFSLREIFHNTPEYSERKLLKMTYQGKEYTALNDIVATKGNIARIVTLLVKINSDKIAEIRGDGLIISSPTGSTAYSLSAGGPIVHPEVDCFIITPICPHSLTLRPFVIPDTVSLTIEPCADTKDLLITIDGQRLINMKPEESFTVQSCPGKLKIIEASELNYFRLLSEKLNWGL